MSCFEARNDFVAFWEKTLADDRRAQLLSHMCGCSTCDRSFRIFALTAPVLYSATDPNWNSGPARPKGIHGGAFNLPKAPSLAEYRLGVRRLNRILPAFVMAASAAIVIYFAAPPRMTFEDAVAADNSNAEVASYRTTDSFFDQELMTQGTTAPDLADE
jgi:hypothetical protein